MICEKRCVPRLQIVERRLGRNNGEEIREIREIHHNGKGSARNVNPVLYAGPIPLLICSGSNVVRQYKICLLWQKLFSSTSTNGDQKLSFLQHGH